MHTYAENLEAAIKHIDDRAAFISVDNGKRMWPFFFSVTPSCSCQEGDRDPCRQGLRRSARLNEHDITQECSSE